MLMPGKLYKTLKMDSWRVGTPFKPLKDKNNNFYQVVLIHKDEVLMFVEKSKDSYKSCYQFLYENIIIHAHIFDMTAGPLTTDEYIKEYIIEI